MGKIVDNRADKTAPFGFVVFTDSFLSGWGGASGGRSLYALAVADPTEARRVLESGKRRSDMKRGRFVRTLRNVRVRPADHLKIVDRGQAERWYEPDGFGEAR